MASGNLLEFTMMTCFGSSWVFSLIRSWRSHATGGKSIVFLWIILAGYLSGIGHKVWFHYDRVIWLYVLNSAMVVADISLYYRNWREECRRAACVPDAQRQLG